MKNEYLNSMITALEHAAVKARWYKDTNDSYHLKECKDWLEVANIYMQNISPVDNNPDEVDYLLGSLEIQ